MENENRKRVINVADFHDDITVLGPGNRFVIWVQGCNMNCPNCIVPEHKPLNGGKCYKVNELLEMILKKVNIEGITISGGEPMLQAGALFTLCKKIKEKSDLSILCYTGLLLENIIETCDEFQILFLEQIDILIDGPYIQELNDGSLWRGSSNQRIFFLNDKYKYLKKEINIKQHKFHVVVEEDKIKVIGIPPADFFEELKSKINKNKGKVIF